ncbi:hypothetical protein glysoja_021039 [Glycine soja]|nr:hypothetical protein JHK87_037829 [Glycine soja]KHN21459.1 hypothetical protein glysoja_021039 [Glycine soja]
MMSETSLEDFMSALQSNTTNLWIQIFHVFLHTIDQHYLWLEQNDVPLVVIELEENSTTACRELGE